MINVIEELELLQIEVNGGNISCPVHKDNNPSCRIDLITGQYFCQASSCNARGDFVDLLSKVKKITPVDARKYIEKKYGVSLMKSISPVLVEDYHKAIWDHPESIAALKERAVDNELITKYRIGWANERITIPIPGPDGFYANLRYYSPGSKVNKFYSQKDYDANLLFPFTQLDYDKLIYVAGEIKAIACAAILNQHGYGVFTGLQGEGNIDTKYYHYFDDKDFYVIMDVDSAGRKASGRVCHLVSSVASKVYDVLLSLDRTKFPKGGVDDFIADGGDIFQAIKDAELYEPNKKDSQETKTVTLSEAYSAGASSLPVKYTGAVACLGESVYHIPSSVEITCDKSQPECQLCNMVFTQRDPIHDLDPESKFVLDTAGCTDASQRDAVGSALEIPRTCKVWDYEVKARYAVEEIRISPELDITNRDVDREMQPAFLVKNEDDEAVLSNETYEFTGRTWPSPKTQAAVSVIYHYELVESALESYVCEDPERLNVFRPAEWTVEAIREKLNDIYLDFEANVCRIYERRELYFATDLTYHSPLFFDFDGKKQNGWISTLILGDSSQGKSEVTRMMMEHYKLGELVECGATTPAGILGGIDEIGGGRFITWGVLAQHDKRLVVLDELSEAPENLLGMMNDARSRGLIQITKIKKARARARTRTIMLSNPRLGQMSRYNHGINAVTDLISHPQYIRRFDLTLLVAADEVDSRKLQTYRPKAEHKYTSELSNELVLWAWTIKDVDFEDQKYILEQAVTLTDNYTEEVPIIDKGSMRLKLARLAAACAARTYSREGEKLIVRKCHVDFVVEFLNKIYSKPACGYLDYSKAKKELESLRQPELILSQINSLAFPSDFCTNVLYANEVDLTLLQDSGSLERNEAQSLLSLLVRHRAVRRSGKRYYKSTEFTAKLKHWVGNGALTKPPEFLK